MGDFRDQKPAAQQDEPAANVAILRKAYQAWADSHGLDTACWLSIMADDARLNSLADGAAGVRFTRARAGASDILDYLNALAAEWDLYFCRIDEYVAQGDRVVAIGATSWRNKRTGRVFVTPKLDVWRFRNGKIVQFSEFYDTALLFAAVRS